jgi:hypothetical protein
MKEGGEMEEGIEIEGWRDKGKREGGRGKRGEEGGK